MSEEQALLRAVVERPAEAGATWLVLADWLEERGRSPEAELIRLQHQQTWRPDLDARARQARIVELLVAGVRPCVPRWTNPLGISFVWCPPGSFLMGSPKDEYLRDSDEAAHTVTLARGFWLGETPVTQGQWRSATGESVGHFKGLQRPAENISWTECQELCRRLGELDGREYRLPTEAEWEYAARAGTTTPFFWGDTISTELANYDATAAYGPMGSTGEYRQQTVRVDAFPPNVWGLCQMHGNVREWCADWHGPYLRRRSVTDPQGPATGNGRSVRGGSWYSFPQWCRSAYRFVLGEDGRSNEVGVRLCVSA